MQTPHDAHLNGFDFSFNFPFANNKNKFAINVRTNTL